MQLQTSSDPLGEATTVTVDLPRQELGHFRPWDEIAALHAAGLESTSAVFIDAPTKKTRHLAGGRCRLPPRDLRQRPRGDGDAAGVGADTHRAPLPLPPRGEGGEIPVSCRAAGPARVDVAARFQRCPH